MNSFNLKIKRLFHTRIPMNIMTEINLNPDFFILVIIDREFEAIKQVFQLGNAIPYKGRDYYEGSISGLGGKSYSVVCTQSYHAGNVSSATVTSVILNNFKPRYLLLVGIAGGVHGKENIKIGDVVVSTEVKYYELEKQTKGKKTDKSGVNATPSQTLLNSYRRIKDQDWQSLIPEERPENNKEKSVSLSGKILSGEKLLGDENSELLKHLLTIHETALAVEMEGAGVARAIYEESTHNKVEFLDIRGISDYCNTGDNQGDRDTWRKHSSLVAATFAKYLIENTNIDPSTQSPHEKYIELYNKNIPKKKSIEFNLEIKTPDVKQSADLLLKFLKDSRKVVLQGNAGGGKSVLVRRLSSYLVAEGITPILVDREMWTTEISKELMEKKNDTLNERLNIILKASVVSTTIETIESFSNHSSCIIVDGLNEIPGSDHGDELQRVIVNTVADYVQHNLESLAIIADRHTSREFLANWKQVELQKLSDDVVKSIIDENFGVDHYDGLPKENKDILSSAFFLNFALEMDSAELSSKAGTIAEYFQKIPLNDDELELLSKLVFDAGMKHRQLTFQIEDLEEFGAEKIKLLKDSGVLRVKDGKADFNHQLYHEFLFSRHLYKNKLLWNHDYFDMVTLKSNSPESLFMTLEQIGDQNYADDFLLAVYDWNWKIAIRTVEWNSRMNIKKFSDELVATMLAMVSMKQQDPVQNTSHSSRNLLASSVLTRAEEFANATTINDIADIVKTVDVKYNWIKEFKELFSINRDSSLQEDQILLINSCVSIVGWAATNIMRECKLDDQNLLQLRTIYNSADSSESFQNTRRWRIVHILGNFYTQENVSLLFKALRDDPYHWVRYGSVRSLVEIAANSEELRSGILDELSNELENLEPHLLDEMAKTGFYRTAKGDWVKDFLPLLEKVKGLGDDIHKEKWENRIQEFREGTWKD